MRTSKVHLPSIQIAWAFLLACIWLALRLLTTSGCAASLTDLSSWYLGGGGAIKRVVLQIRLDRAAALIKRPLLSRLDRHFLSSESVADNHAVHQKSTLKPKRRCPDKAMSLSTAEPKFSPFVDFWGRTVAAFVTPIQMCSGPSLQISFVYFLIIPVLPKTENPAKTLVFRPLKSTQIRPNPFFFASGWYRLIQPDSVWPFCFLFLGARCTPCT